MRRDFGEVLKLSFTAAFFFFFFESCKLSFIWGKMRTLVRETAPLIALRDYSKKVIGGG